MQFQTIIIILNLCSRLDLLVFLFFLLFLLLFRFVLCITGFLTTFLACLFAGYCIHFLFAVLLIFNFLREFFLQC